jgi:hypothetical protein
MAKIIYLVEDIKSVSELEIGYLNIFNRWGHSTILCSHLSDGDLDWVQIFVVSPNVSEEQLRERVYSKGFDKMVDSVIKLRSFKE